MSDGPNKMNEPLPVGTEVVLINNQDGLLPGSRGVIRGIQPSGFYSVYVTHSVSPTWYGHGSGGEGDYIDPHSRKSRGWNVDPKNLKEYFLEIPYDPTQQADQDDDI
jgi:hypothetical protein